MEQCWVAVCSQIVAMNQFQLQIFFLFSFHLPNDGDTVQTLSINEGATCGYVFPRAVEYYLSASVPRDCQT